jgi:hypothetical protein
MRSASIHQSPASGSQVANRAIDYLTPTTRIRIDEIQAKNRRYYNTRSQALLNEAHHVATFVPDPDTSIETNYCMPMANEVTHPVTGESLKQRNQIGVKETTMHMGGFFKDTRGG